MEKKLDRALAKTVCSIAVFFSVLIAIYAIFILVKINSLKSFTFLKTQTRMVLCFSVCLFFYGAIYFVETNGPDKKPTTSLVVTLALVGFCFVVLECLIFWNLVCMYWQSASQL